MPVVHDHLLDAFIPEPDVAEHHSIRIAAPAEFVFAAACAMDLEDSSIVRTIFRAREWILGAHPVHGPGPHGLVGWSESLGWGCLAAIPGREIVMGAITQPWAPDVVFRAVPASRFASHSEAAHVKIVWTLRVEPVSPNETILHTETRAIACDIEARRRFQWYWRLFSPGIILIRLALLRRLRNSLESRPRVMMRAAAVWVIFMAIEFLQGILRVLFVAPRLGDFPARQLGAVAGSVIALLVAAIFSRWIGASAKPALIGVGLVWVTLTIVFELGLGHLAGYSWERILEDYDLMRGGLLGLAMMILAVAPMAGAAIRKSIR